MYDLQLEDGETDAQMMYVIQHEKKRIKYGENRTLAKSCQYNVSLFCPELLFHFSCQPWSQSWQPPGPTALMTLRTTYLLDEDNLLELHPMSWGFPSDALNPIGPQWLFQKMVPWVWNGQGLSKARWSQARLQTEDKAQGAEHRERHCQRRGWKSGRVEKKMPWVICEGGKSYNK